MGKILSNYKKSIIDDVKTSISSNASVYYAFASNPVPYVSDPPTSTNDDYSNVYLNNWYLLFGKRLSNTDVMHMTRLIEWTSNTSYTRYDNTANNLANSEFFVLVPADPGEYRHVYKCIDNANGEPSTVAPDLQQSSSFTKSDGYTWRYLYSISDVNYIKFATDDYIPITPNTTIQSSAASYSGVEVVVVESGGNGYITYHSGTVQSVVNSTLIQIENSASEDNFFYVNNAIYFTNNVESTAQLKVITGYVSNLTGNWVTLDSSANITNISPDITEYSISPRVIFDTDATSEPSAYSVMNTTSNSIASIVVIEPGSGVTRATATISSNSIYGSGANLYCIVPPPGGHGSNPASELDIVGMGIAFSFANSESDTVPIETTYNKIGIYKNPYALLANNSKGSAYTDATFKQVLVANISPSVTFSNNDIVTGQDSGAIGVLAFANSTQIYLVGDMNFSNGELIVSSNLAVSTTITINSIGDIYVKDLCPLYTQNIDDVTRANNQTESFKLIVQV